MDYIDKFSDDQIRELRENADDTFREVYISVADLPKAEWPVAKIKHLSELRKAIAKYDAEVRRRQPASESRGIVSTPTGTEVRSRPARLFISYAHADESYKKTLEKHIALLARIGLIETWSDRSLVPGKPWDQEILSQLHKADVILLLVSANFLASDYSYSKEVAIALERMRSDGTVVIPIILSPVDWTIAPFASMQALPENAKPVSTWDNQDEAWAQVAKGIRTAILSIGLGGS
jgi:nucleotide-binding universal stress UspA family protein